MHTLEDVFRLLLTKLGEDPTRGGLLDTPKRMAKAWNFWTSGYGERAEDVLATQFEDGAEGYDEMVLVRDIPFYSHCEHHMAPFFGTCSVGYIPRRAVVGLSKLGRLTNMHARRLQVQERMTNAIADDIDRVLNPKGVGVIIRARHLCMESRGVCQTGHHTVTSALRGAFKTKPEARAEFLSLTAH